MSQSLDDTLGDEVSNMDLGPDAELELKAASFTTKSGQVNPMHWNNEIAKDAFFPIDLIGTTDCIDWTAASHSFGAQTASILQTITALALYRHWSIEELRCLDYQLGKGNIHGRDSRAVQKLPYCKVVDVSLLPTSTSSTMIHSPKDSTTQVASQSLKQGVAPLKGSSLQTSCPWEARRGVSILEDPAREALAPNDVAVKFRLERGLFDKKPTTKALLSDCVAEIEASNEHLAKYLAVKARPFKCIGCLEKVAAWPRTQIESFTLTLETKFDGDVASDNDDAASYPLGIPLHVDSRVDVLIGNPIEVYPWTRSLPRALLSDVSGTVKGLLARIKPLEPYIQILNTTPEVFEHFIEWMYNRPTSFNLTYLYDDPECPKNMESLCYVLGDQLQAPAFKNYCIRSIYDRLVDRSACNSQPHPLSSMELEFVLQTNPSWNNHSRLYHDIVDKTLAEGPSVHSLTVVERLQALKYPKTKKMPNAPSGAQHRCTLGKCLGPGPVEEYLEDETVIARKIVTQRVGDYGGDEEAWDSLEELLEAVEL